MTAPSVWPSYGLPGSALAYSTNTPPGARPLVVVIEALTPKLVGRCGFALADALDLGSMERIKLPTALALLLRADLAGACQRPLKHRFKLRLVDDVAADVADKAAEPSTQEAQLPLVALELFGMGIAARHQGGAFGEPQIRLAQPHAVLFGQPIEPLDGGMQQLGVGREADRLGLH